jgi:hypothetical protein
MFNLLSHTTKTYASVGLLIGLVAANTMGAAENPEMNILPSICIIVGSLLGSLRIDQILEKKQHPYPLRFFDRAFHLTPYKAQIQASEIDISMSHRIAALAA